MGITVAFNARGDRAGQVHQALVLGLVFVVIVILSGCGTNTTKNPATTTNPSPSPTPTPTQPTPPPTAYPTPPPSPSADFPLYASRSYHVVASVEPASRSSSHAASGCIERFS